MAREAAAFVAASDTVFVLIDTNSDSREIELTVYRRNLDGGWETVGDFDDVGDPGMAPVEMPGYAYGRTRPSATVTIACRDAEYRVQANSLGW